MQIINTIKCFLRYKRVHMNEMKAERRRIEKERQDIEKMIQELKELKGIDSNKDESK